MTKLSLITFSKRLRTTLASTLFSVACILTVTALRAQAPNANPPAQWPEKAPYDAAIDAFDAALTRSGWDKDYRTRLSKSCDSARAAVAEQGNINIPDNRTIIFYEAQDIERKEPAPGRPPKLNKSRMSEYVHVFVLPPFDPNNKAVKYKYEDWFMCCYEWWTRSTPTATPSPSR